MLTSLALIIILVFVVWPDSRGRLESWLIRRLPRVHLVTFRAIEHYKADLHRRYPEHPDDRAA